MVRYVCLSVILFLFLLLFRMKIQNLHLFIYLFFSYCKFLISIYSTEENLFICLSFTCDSIVMVCQPISLFIFVCIRMKIQNLRSFILVFFRDKYVLLQTTKQLRCTKIQKIFLCIEGHAW